MGKFTLTAWVLGASSLLINNRFTGPSLAPAPPLPVNVCRKVPGARLHWAWAYVGFPLIPLTPCSNCLLAPTSKALPMAAALHSSPSGWKSPDDSAVWGYLFYKPFIFWVSFNLLDFFWPHISMNTDCMLATLLQHHSVAHLKIFSFFSSCNLQAFNFNHNE